MSCQVMTEKLNELRAKSSDFKEILMNKGFEACRDIQKEVHKLACEALYEVPDQVALRSYLANMTVDKYRRILWVGPFKEGFARVENASGPQFFIDKYGNLLFAGAHSFSQVFRDFNDGRAIGDDSNGYYFINEMGKKIGDYYTQAENFQEGFAKVEKKSQRINVGNNWSRVDTRALFIDKNGKNIFNKEFLEAQSFSDGLAAVRGTDGSWHYLSRNGEIAIEGPFAGAYPFHNGRALVQTIGEGWCIIDKEGNRVGEGGFDEANDFHEGFALVKKGHNSFFVSEDGKNPFVRKNFIRGKAYPQKYRGGYDFSEGYAVIANITPAFTLNFINTRGESLLKRDYCLRAESFENGFALVATDSIFGDFLWTFIDKSGKKISKEVFDEAGSFSENGLARVKKDGKWFFINSRGESAFPGSFYFADNFVNGIARVVTEDNKTYYIDSKGRYVMGEKPE